MSTLLDVRERCKVVLINPLNGRQFEVERLPRRPGSYARGYKLTAADGEPLFAHELPGGRQECSCPAWTEKRECEHTALLIGAGLFDEPAWFGPVTGDDFPEDELVVIDWESDAP